MRRLALLAAAFCAAALAAPGAVGADTISSGTLRLVAVGTFSMPVYAVSPPGDASRLFVVEQGGSTAPARIRLVHAGATTTFADLSVDVLAGGERGLLSIAFPPDYGVNGLFYVFYTAQPDGRLRIEERRRSAADPNVADPSYKRMLIEVPHPDATNHNGGQLQFGPDGHLWASTGDGGGSNDQYGNAQDLGDLLGKILRLDRSGAPAPGNPPAGWPGARPEIWLYGLRNPWRFSFDALTGDLAIGDVGQGTREEVDFFARGQGGGSNLGWSRYEGEVERDSRVALQGPGPYAPPVLTYATHVGGTCAVTGGYVSRDLSVGELLGRYVYADFCAGQLRSAVLSAGGSTGDAPVGASTAPLQVSSLSSFGQDALCRLYVTSLGGLVYRIESAAPAAPAGCQSAPSVGGAGGGATPGGGPSPVATPVDRTPPRLSRATLARRRFAVSRRPTARVARGAAPLAATSGARRRPRRGTTFRYTLSEPATITIRLYRPLPGRRSGRRCLAPRRAPRGARCTRYPPRGSLVRRNLRAGRRATPFSGRVGRRALAPGRYRATLRARDAAGNVSRGVALGFTVLRG